MNSKWLVCLAVGFLGACGDGANGAATSSPSASAKPAAATSAAASATPAATASAAAPASAAPAASAAAEGAEVTEAEFLGEIEKFFEAIHENAADCAKMAEALKGVKPSPEREKALDAFEKKAKADPETKKRVDDAVQKLEEKYPIADGMKKCADDAAVKAILKKD